MLVALGCITVTFLYYVSFPSSIHKETDAVTVEVASSLFESEANGELFDLKCQCAKPIKPENALHPALIHHAPEKDFFENSGMNPFSIRAIKAKCWQETEFAKAIVTNYKQAKEEFENAGCISADSVDFKCDNEGVLKDEYGRECDISSTDA